ncbi:MAG TPA: thioredoxin family protein [Thermoanaerobaculia bacterium]|jgi:thiol:disulfide interchange protein|nr:thioredoxin family protein [Thermoanaerobaculia bacterium]
MDIQWTDDVDQALAEAKKNGKPLLLDFTAAPM